MRLQSLSFYGKFKTRSEWGCSGSKSLSHPSVWWLYISSLASSPPPPHLTLLYFMSTSYVLNLRYLGPRKCLPWEMLCLFWCINWHHIHACFGIQQLCYEKHQIQSGKYIWHPMCILGRLLVLFSADRSRVMFHKMTGKIHYDCMTLA